MLVERTAYAQDRARRSSTPATCSAATGPAIVMWTSDLADVP